MVSVFKMVSVIIMVSVVIMVPLVTEVTCHVTQQNANPKCILFTFQCENEFALRFVRNVINGFPCHVVWLHIQQLKYVGCCKWFLILLQMTVLIGT